MIKSPDDHLGLAFGIVLIWVALIVFAALGRVTSHIGRDDD